MAPIGRNKAEQIIDAYRKGFAERRKQGEDLLDHLADYLATGGYGKAPRKELQKFAIALGLVELTRGRFGGVISPLSDEERAALEVAREIAKEEPEPEAPQQTTSGIPDPLMGLSEAERAMIMKMAETLRAAKQ